MPGIRIGSPDSPIAAGTPVPGKPGKVYQAGQFAPSIDELATSTFSEASKSGLLSTDLPIYDDEGNVSEEKVKSWKPSEDLPHVIVSSQIDKFSMSVVVSVNNLYPNLFSTLNLVSIKSGDEEEGDKTTHGTRLAMGDSLITAKTSSRNVRFVSTMYVYPKFYQYLTTPIVAAIPGRTKGVSVSMFAVLKAMGHILFNKLIFDNELTLIGNFLDANGWSKDSSSGNRGSFLHKKNMSSYYHKGRSVSEVAKYSPMEDFAETFAHYMTHRAYLVMVFPETLQVMDSIVEHYGLV